MESSPPLLDKGNTLSVPKELLPTLYMASRQKAPVDNPQQPAADEEAVSGTGEGDEIMEEAEEQEDGYSEPFSHPHRC